MDRIILAILPILLIVILYVLVLSRKGEVQRAKTSFKSYDWITNLALIFGVIALLNGMNALGIEFSQIWSVIILVLLFCLLFGVIVYRIRKGKPIIRQVGDERTEMIYAKSSRNSLMITYLALLISLTQETTTLETRQIVITLGAGLVAFIGSLFFYYFKKS